MNKGTSLIPETVCHMEKIYPNSNRSTQLKIRKQLMTETGNKSGLVLFCDNTRP